MSGKRIATTADVFASRAPWGIDCGDCLPWLESLAPRSVACFVTSCPYEGQRTYGIDFARVGQTWVDWMRPIVRAMCHASNGLVLVNMASPVRDWSYSPAVEWLVSDLTRLDGIVCGPRPYAWVKSENDPEADGNGTPGSGSTHYQRSDWEPIYAFALPDRLPGGGRQFWSDNTAFGHPPKWAPGGEPSHRGKDGKRANDPWQKRGRGNNLGGRKASGEKKLGTRAAASLTLGVRQTRGGQDVLVEQTYAPPPLSNPGNVIRAPVGGGKLGHPLAHEGEAPMSLYVVERFVCWFSPPGSIVADPFTGTGTTAHAALNHGRRFVGCDIRQSQVDLAATRLRTVTPTLFAGMEAD